MKKLLLLIVLFIAIKSQAQVVRANEVIADERLYVPVQDTMKTPKRLGEMTYRPQDKKYYKVISMTAGTKRWQVEGGVQTLQEVTTAGNKTADTVIAKAIRTNVILPDTLSEPDYEIVIMPDLQLMTQDYPAILRGMYDWIIANKTTNNIKSVLTVGDIVNRSYTSQFDTAIIGFNRLHAAGIPHLPVIGNHDYDAIIAADVSDRNLVMWNSYFGPSYFAGKSYYKNCFQNSTANYYVNVDIGSKKYSYMALEFFPRDSALAWAANIIDSLKEREFIICTHAYIDETGKYSVDNGLYSVNHYFSSIENANSGLEMWQKLISKYPNISLVFNGHFIQGNVFKYLPDVGVNGNIVRQVFYNRQDDPNGGNGYLLRMKVSPSKGTMKFVAYSPFLSAFDPMVDSSTIYYPSIQIKGDVGVKELYVNGNAKLDSNLSVEKNSELKGNTTFIGNTFFNKLTAGRIPFTTTSGKLRDSSGFRYDTTINGMFVNKVIASTTGTYPVLYATASNPAQVNIVHGASNYGLAITRAEAGSGSANMVFYKTRNADPTIRTASAVSDLIGNIGFHVVGTDNNTISNTRVIEVVTSTIGSTYGSSIMNFRGRDSLGNFGYMQVFKNDGSFSTGYGATVPHGSALIDMQSTVKGFLPPRLTTTQMNAIYLPATGLMIWNTDSIDYMTYNGASWRKVSGTGGGGGGGGTPSLTSTQIGVGNSSNLLAGSSAFTFDATTGIIKNESANDSRIILKTTGGSQYIRMDFVTPSSDIRLGFGGPGASAYYVYENNYGHTYMAFDKMTGTGNIGIGGNSLSVADGTGGMLYVHNTAGLSIGSGTTPSEKLDVSGNIIASGTITPSDKRYKQNIVTVKNALGKVMMLKPKTYEYRTKDFINKHFNEGKQYGLIAQEVEKVLPELVKTYADEYKGLNYTELIPLLVGAIQEQQKQINDLKKEVKKLQQK